MTPEISRACAVVKTAMALEPGPTLDELLDAAEDARDIEDLPQWAQAVLNWADRAA